MGGALRKVLIVTILGLVLPMRAWAGDHMKFELVPAFDQVVPGGSILVGLTEIPDSGWHSYWKNPGETGLAADIQWKLPSGVSAGKVKWPAPDRILYADEVSYGYTSAATLLIPLHIGKSLKPGTSLHLRAHVDSLVCNDVCEPVSADIARTIRVVASAAHGPSRLAGAERALPIPFHGHVKATQRDGFVEVSLASAPAGASSKGAYLFAEEDGVLDASAPQDVTDHARSMTIRVKAASKALPKSALHFVLKLSDGSAYRLSAAEAAMPASTKASAGLVLVLLLAFAGGLILNLMPCVFPILSMKLLALTKAGHDKPMAQREALVYSVGAVLSFLALALALELARRFGASLGWGFQLQSPLVIAVLSILLLLIALNMSGVFEVGTSLQALAGSLGMNARLRANPYTNAFLTGVLAVVVAAPCTAPFMATAVGVALSQGGATSIAIFSALGLGFALPFVALTFAITRLPAAARLIPKPGPWMVRLRWVLAIPMYLSALWLVWVFGQQVDTVGLVLLLAALAVVALSVLWSRLPVLLRRAGVGVGAGFALLAAVQTSSAAVATGHMSFSQKRLQTLIEEDRPVLVDMSAAWCITCKVNETLVLSSPEVQRAMKSSKTVYMVGDWTREDTDISHYLAKFGRSGVPLYVYYGPGKEPIVLPQILNAGELVKLLSSNDA